VRKKEICGGRKEIEECHKDDNEDLPAGRKKNAHKKKGPKKKCRPTHVCRNGIPTERKKQYI
jgi:hypothetical protein